ncbi:MAG: addiction module protein [Myxococcota bacterium]
MALARARREVAQLSADEQLQLVEEIWNRLVSSPESVGVPAWHLSELEGRVAEHDASPDDVVPWERLKGELGS